MNMPCSLAGQSKPLAVSGPPQAWTTSPSLLNSTTDGAVKQHLDLSPRWARLSRSFTVRGRWLIQTLSSLSTKMPPICPRIQLFGSGFGQLASISNLGVASAAMTSAAAVVIANTTPANAALGSILFMTLSSLRPAVGLQLFRDELLDHRARAVRLRPFL